MMSVALDIADEQWHEAKKEIDALKNELEAVRSQRDALQTRMSELVLERQRANRYGNRKRRQSVVIWWARRMFGSNTLKFTERAMRVVEEAIEVAQAVGVPVNTVERIVHRVYTKAAGEVVEELGGLLVTTLALAEVLNKDADELERDELERILSLPEHLPRESQMRKHALGIGERVDIEAIVR